jgi:non-heme chloroperoxidase
MNPPTARCDTTFEAALPNGIQLHFVEMGRGTPVILLHGGMGDCYLWVDHMNAIALQFRVIAYSRRHNYPNRNPSASSAHDIGIDIDDLLAFQRQLQVGPAHLVGTSYGAIVALGFALKHPDLTLSLALAEPPLHQWARSTTAGERHYNTFIDTVWCPAAQAFDLGLERRALQILTDGIWGRALFDSLPSSQCEAALRNVASMRVLTHAPDPFPDWQRSAVSKLAIPILLLYGEHASELHRCVIDELAQVVPTAKKAEIAGAGHGSLYENRDGFRDALMTFLNDQGLPQ